MPINWHCRHIPFIKINGLCYFTFYSQSDWSEALLCCSYMHGNVMFFVFGHIWLMEEGTGETYFFIFQGIFFFYSNIFKYVQKLAQNHLCWSNIRDFISCTGQNNCKKGIWGVSRQSSKREIFSSCLKG